MDDFKRNLYDAVQDNFKVACRKNYLHRIVYIGEHNYTERETFKQYIHQKIKTLHERYYDEVLTGFLLAYPTHFVHLIEGSEITLMDHLASVCADDALLSRMKVLIVSYHISQRFYPKWGYAICHPPILFEKLDPECPLEEMARQTKICISKVYRLTKTLLTQSSTGFSVVNEGFSDKYPALLPECALLDFLLGSNTLRDLRKYAGNYKKVMDMCQYDNTVWPLACEYIPTNVLGSLPVIKPNLSGVDEEENDDDLLASDTYDDDEEATEGEASPGSPASPDSPNNDDTADASRPATVEAKPEPEPQDGLL